MTITLELTPEEEAKLTAKARAVGIDDPAEYLHEMIGAPAEQLERNDAGSKPYPHMAKYLREAGLIGTVASKPRADGRSWSEIEGFEFDDKAIP